LAHVNAKVIVSFVVGVDGRVEDARVIESSDSRFDASALEAIRRFTFIPAEGVNGPTREIAMQPFNFWWSPKAHSSENSPSRQ
jgi:TonB family protein